MSASLKELIRILSLNKIDENLFVGESQNLFAGRIFGGQVVAQALSAAQQSVPDHLRLHSCQSYFILAGDAFNDVVYQVERLRDGKSFATRRITATQGGVPIFNLSASFQKVEEGFEHAAEMPEVPDIEALTSENDRLRELGEKLGGRLQKVLNREHPIELRVQYPIDHLAPSKEKPVQGIWMKASADVDSPLAMHQFLLAYASDFNFLTAAMLPHGVSNFQPNMQVASLDHCVWFHRPLSMNDWLFYSIDSPSASGARGFVRGQIFTREGVLVASTAQEGLIRQH